MNKKDRCSREQVHVVRYQSQECRQITSQAKRYGNPQLDCALEDKMAEKGAHQKKKLDLSYIQYESAWVPITFTHIGTSGWNEYRRQRQFSIWLATTL